MISCKIWRQLRCIITKNFVSVKLEAVPVGRTSPSIGILPGPGRAERLILDCKWLQTAGSKYRSFCHVTISIINCFTDKELWRAYHLWRTYKTIEYFWMTSTPHYWQLLLNIPDRFCSIKYCWGFCEENTIVNSIPIGLLNWISILIMIPLNVEI